MKAEKRADEFSQLAVFILLDQDIMLINIDTQRGEKDASNNKPYIMYSNNMYFFSLIVSGGKEDAAITIMHTLSHMIAFTCFFTDKMYYFPTYIARFWRKGRDSHSYHAYTYMIAFTCFVNCHFVIVYELLYFQ